MNGRRARRLSMVSLAVTVAIMAVPAGVRPAAAHGSATRASAVDLAYVAAQIRQYRAIPRFIAPGPPFGARQAVKGQSIFRYDPSGEAAEMYRDLAKEVLSGEKARKHA